MRHLQRTSYRPCTTCGLQFTKTVDVSTIIKNQYDVPGFHRMQSSDIIVAINKDPKAPIVSVANFALIGDLNRIIPELINQLQSK